MVDQLPHYVGVAGVYGGHERASLPCGVVVFLCSRSALKQNVDDLAVPIKTGNLQCGPPRQKLRQLEVVV